MNVSVNQLVTASEKMGANLVIYQVMEDGSYNRLFHTSGVCKLVGLTEEEYEATSGNGILTFAPENELVVVKEKLNEIVRTGKAMSFTHRLVNKDNAQIWVNVNAAIVGEFDGRKLMLVEIYDTSALSGQYEQVINQTERLIYVVDRDDFELLYANKGACKIFSLEEGKYVGRKCYELLDDDEIHTEVNECWAYMALVAGKPIIVQNPKNGDYYEVLSKEGSWGSHEAIFVYFTECTQALEEKKQQREHYRKTFQSIIKMNRHAVGSYQINVTKGIVIDGYSKNHSFNVLSLEPMENFLTRVAEHFPDPDNRKEFLEKFECNNLLELYRNGERTFQFEHFYITDKGQFLYLTTITMIKNPATEDIEAVIYSHDISGSYMDKQIKHLLLEQKYEKLYIIEIGQRKLVKYTGIDIVKNTESQLGDSFEYDEGRQKLLEKYIVPEDRDFFMEQTELSTIIRTLRLKKEYSFVCRCLRTSGITSYMQITTMFLDERKEEIICVLKDITEKLDIDDLTKAYNRKGFIHQVEDTLRLSPNEDFAVLYFDINHFKAINERFGIDFGDLVLKQFVEELKNSSLNPVAVARLEGDHFTALMSVSDLNFDALHHICIDPFVVEGHELNLFISCGIYMIEDRKKSISRMMDRAKLAKEYIEDPYMKSYCIFDSSMRIAYMAKNELANDISSALKNNEFEVYYQPIFRAKDGKLASAEALIRWNHPSRGIISPSFFIPNLEESGQITEVDFFVAKSVREFQEQRLAEGKPLIPIDINLTWIDFYDKSGMTELYKEIKKSPVEKKYFSLEVTESTYTSIIDNSSHILEQFRNLGCNVMMDDFGSGYSSFSMMGNFAFDVIKLDMGFIKQIGVNNKMEAVLESMIDMAHKLGTTVIAEGVESKEQLEFLICAGCDLIQGFYFSKPLPMGEFARILDESQIVTS